MKLLFIRDFTAKFKRSGKISFDPMEDPLFYFSSLDISMLLFDVVVPWKTFDYEDLKRYYSPSRFLDAVKEGFIFPYLALDLYLPEVYMRDPMVWKKLPKQIKEDVNLIHAILDLENYVHAEPADKEEIKIFKSLYHEDINDKKLAQIVSKLYGVERQRIVEYLNSDLAVAHRLETSLLTRSRDRPIWNYKLSKIQKAIRKDLGIVKDVEPLVPFIQKLTLRAPRNLEIDEIKAFRKDNASSKFRSWFSEIMNKVQGDPFISISLDEALLSDFRELCQSYEKKKFYARVVLTSLVTTLTTLAYPPAGVASTVLMQLSSDKIYSWFYCKYGDKNWVLHILTLRK